jgi:hypothetical protein
MGESEKSPMKEVIFAILEMMHAHSIAIGALEERMTALETVVNQGRDGEAQSLRTALASVKQGLLQKRIEAQQNYEEMRRLLASLPN